MLKGNISMTIPAELGSLQTQVVEENYPTMASLQPYLPTSSLTGGLLNINSRCVHIVPIHFNCLFILRDSSTNLFEIST